MFQGNKETCIVGNLIIPQALFGGITISILLIVFP